MNSDDEAQPVAVGIDGETFLVLVNDEEQYSIWPSETAVPAGWSYACGPATKSMCLAFVEEHWVDMRPRSLTRAVEGQ